MSGGHSPSRPGWTRVRLHAARDAALADEAVHDTVVASAEAIAERTGVRLVSIEVDDAGVTALVEGDRLIAIGLAAELRRLTGAWYAKRHPGEHLWIDPPERGPNDDDEGFGGDGPSDGPDDGPDEGPGSGPSEDAETGETRYGLPEFRDPYAFNDEDLLMSDPDVLHDMEIIEENLTDDDSGEDSPLDDDFPPDDPYWRRKNDPF